MFSKNEKTEKLDFALREAYKENSCYEPVIQLEWADSIVKKIQKNDWNYTPNIVFIDRLNIPFASAIAIFCGLLSIYAISETIDAADFLITNMLFNDQFNFMSTS